MKDTSKYHLEIQVKIDGTDSVFEFDRGSFAFYESMDFFFPYAQLRVPDSYGIYVNAYPFTQNTQVEIVLKDDEDQTSFKFIPFSQSSDMKNSANSGYQTVLDLIHPKAPQFLLPAEYKSKKCKGSEYAKYLIKSAGLKPVVEDSDVERDWICPGWKNPQMLRYLAQHSRSASGSYGYRYFANRFDEVVFKTFDKFFEEDENGEDLEIYYADSNSLNLKLHRNIASSLFLSANNLKLNQYNLESDSNKNKESTYSDMVKKYGRVAGVSEDFKIFGSTKHTGIYRDNYIYPSEYYKSLYNKSVVFSESNSVQVVVRHGMTNRKVGGIVNLKFKDHDNKALTLPYSGRYVIKDLTTYGNWEVYQRLNLVRPGLNIDRDRVI